MGASLTKREAWIDANWGAAPPVPWTADREMEMPEELRDFSQVDEDVAPEDDYPELPGRLRGTAIRKREPAQDDMMATPANSGPPLAAGWRSPKFSKKSRRF